MTETIEEQAYRLIAPKIAHMNGLVDEALVIISDSFGLVGVRRPKVEHDSHSYYTHGDETNDCTIGIHLTDSPLELSVGEEVGHAVHFQINPGIFHMDDLYYQDIYAEPEETVPLVKDELKCLNDFGNVQELVGALGAFLFLRSKGKEPLFWEHVDWYLQNGFGKKDFFATLDFTTKWSRFNQNNNYKLAYPLIDKYRNAMPSEKTIQKIVRARCWDEVVNIFEGGRR